MSHQVLARKWRPRSFQEMAGQEHVLRVLMNALDQKRLHHAYLFTGTRGVGKTTAARIFARCLNCEQGITAQACGTCNACQEISEGRFLDLIEIDAASRTKVEDTREILENVQYPPTHGRYKVYLIDEVHMLSGHSFNALLKTLEEPPPYVIFILATTDPQRLPITVLSRCLQFNLKNLQPERIIEHLKYILEQEQIAYELPALSSIGRAADGSMRDALSLLDQAIAYGNGQVLYSEVQSMLGTIEQKQLIYILEAIAQNNPTALIQQIHALAEQGINFDQSLEELLNLLHQIALAQVLPQAIDEQSLAHQEILQLANTISSEDTQLFYQIGLIGRRDLHLAPSPRSGFEMILLRMLAFRPSDMAVAEETSPARQNLNKPAAAPSTQTQQQQPTTAAPGPTQTQPPENMSKSVNRSANDWEAILPHLNLAGLGYVLASHCTLENLTDNQIHLLLNPSQAALLNPKQEERLAQAVSNYFGKPMKLSINIGISATESPALAQKRVQNELQQAAESAINTNSQVQSLMQTFDAKIQPGSIKANSGTLAVTSE